MTTYKVWIQIEKIPDEGDPENVSEPHDFGVSFDTLHEAAGEAREILDVWGVDLDKDPLILWEEE